MVGDEGGLEGGVMGGFLCLYLLSFLSLCCFICFSSMFLFSLRVVVVDLGGFTPPGLGFKVEVLGFGRCPFGVDSRTCSD